MSRTAQSSGPPQHGAVPAPASDPALVAALHAGLISAQFTNDRVAELLGPDAIAAMERDQLVPGQLRVLELLREDRRPDPCAVLIGLWLLGQKISAAQVDEALPGVGVAGLRRLNLVHLEREGGGDELCRPSVDLRPYQAEQANGLVDLWVASDLSAAQVQGPLPTEHVLGIGGASLTLAGNIHRAPVRTALEVGTGCGIQLLHLLDHAEHVVATDLSARALDFTAFNLLLNAEALRVDPQDLSQRVELVQGSLLEPVAGRRFDLIISNPPFVITPRRVDEQLEERYTYRDGGRSGDLLMEELITALPEFLTDSGTAQLLGNWEITDHQEWDARPRTWCENLTGSASVDAWFIQREQQDRSEYAETWLRDASTQREPELYRRRYAEYLEDFASRSVLAVGFGMIFLQRRPEQEGATKAPWRRFEALTGAVEQPLGPVIGETAARAVESLDAVLARNLTVAATVTQERHQRFGAEHPEVIIARQGSGLRRGRPLSSPAAGFMGAADGEFTAAELIAAVCSLTETDEDALGAEILELYVDGFLDP